MNIKATMSSGYRWRLVLISVAMVAFGCWSLYDWKIAYPQKQVRYEAFMQLKADNPDASTEQLWLEYAPTQGWSTKVPTGKTPQDIFTQLIMALITLPIGLFFTAKFLIESRHWVAMDDQGVTANGGRVAPWDSMTGLDKTKWQRKGIALLSYDDGGRTRTILLDDFKADRQAIKTIVTAVDMRLNPEEAAEAAAQSDLSGEALDADASSGTETETSEV